MVAINNVMMTVDSVNRMTKIAVVAKKELADFWVEYSVVVVVHAAKKMIELVEVSETEIAVQFH